MEFTDNLSGVSLFIIHFIAVRLTAQSSLKMSAESLNWFICVAICFKLFMQINFKGVYQLASYEFMDN